MGVSALDEILAGVGSAKPESFPVGAVRYSESRLSVRRRRRGAVAPAPKEAEEAKPEKPALSGVMDERGELKFLRDVGKGASEWEYKGQVHRVFGLDEKGELVESASQRLQSGLPIYLAREEDGGLNPFEGVRFNRGVLEREDGSGISKKSQAARGLGEGVDTMLDLGARGLGVAADAVGLDGSGLTEFAEGREAERDAGRTMGEVLTDLRSAYGRRTPGQEMREGGRALGSGLVTIPISAGAGAVGSVAGRFARQKKGVPGLDSDKGDVASAAVAGGLGAAEVAGEAQQEGLESPGAAGVAGGIFGGLSQYYANRIAGGGLGRTSMVGEGSQEALEEVAQAGIRDVAGADVSGEEYAHGAAYGGATGAAIGGALGGGRGKAEATAEEVEREAVKMEGEWFGKWMEARARRIGKENAVQMNEVYGIGRGAPKDSADAATEYVKASNDVKEAVKESGIGGEGQKELHRLTLMGRKEREAVIERMTEKELFAKFDFIPPDFIPQEGDPDELQENKGQAARKFVLDVSSAVRRRAAVYGSVRMAETQKEVVEGYKKLIAEESGVDIDDIPAPSGDAEGAATAKPDKKLVDWNERQIRQAQDFIAGDILNETLSHAAKKAESTGVRPRNEDWQELTRNAYIRLGEAPDAIEHRLETEFGADGKRWFAEKRGYVDKRVRQWKHLEDEMSRRVAVVSEFSSEKKAPKDRLAGALTGRV